MYQQRPAGQAQNPPPGQQQQQQQQPPRSWDPSYRPDPNGPPGSAPPSTASYPPPPGPHARSDRPDMAALHPQYHQPEAYRHLPAPPQQFYPQVQDPYRQQPPNTVNNMNQTAPRQRTAIACKYCRRRKIRCSGFENSEDGRCSNCVRFSQECIFTPVSAQTQAFVPVQAVHGRGARAPGTAPQLYGSYGQPLRQDPYHQQPQYPPPPQQQHQQQQQQQSGYTLPSPTAAYPPHSQPYGQPQAPYPPQPYDAANAGRRRAHDEPHTPTLPPPNPGPNSQLAHRDGDAAHGYAYPDPTTFANGATSPASSANSYQSHPPQPYYPASQQPPVRRASPGSAYSYDHRDSTSPYGPPPGAYGSNQPAPHSSTQPSGRTPPPHSAAGEAGGSNRPGMSIRDIVTDSANSGERSAADSNMLSALNRTSRGGR